MSVVTIRPARREGARVLIVLAGVSGSGKTYSALMLAYGLAGYDAAKVALLDSEHRRGSLYSDILGHATPAARAPFMLADLAAPFSPARYRAAVLECQSAGAGALVIDSGSHEWEGVGGCDDIANEGDPRVPRWNKAKREHRLFVDTLLQCDMHVVVCLRAREKVKMQQVGGKTEVVSIGVQPVCEKNFMFEATASLLMRDGGCYDRIKVPGDLRPNFPGDKPMTAATGYAVRQWVDAGAQTNPRVEKWRNRLLTVTDQGTRYIETVWAKVPQQMQEALGDGFYAELASAAAEFDRQRELARDEAPEAVRAINGEARAPRGVPLEF